MPATLASPPHAAPTLIDAPIAAILAELSSPPGLYILLTVAAVLVWATSAWVLLSESPRAL